MREKRLWSRAETKANLKPESKMKVVWNACEGELDGIKVCQYNENYFKKFIWKLPKGDRSLRNLCKSI